MLIMTQVYVFRPVGKLQRFANFLPGSRTGERFEANRPIFANHAKIDVTFLQYVLPVCNIFAQLRTGERFANRQIFGEVHKIKLISNYIHTHTNIRTVTNCPTNCPANLEDHRNLNLVPLLVPFHLVLPLHLPALEITPDNPNLAPLLASVRPLSLPAGKPQHERAALLAPVSIRLSFSVMILRSGDALIPALLLLLVRRLLVTAVDWRWKQCLKTQEQRVGFAECAV